jgi:hypothetical protein
LLNPVPHAPPPSVPIVVLLSAVLTPCVAAAVTRFVKAR